MSRFFPVERIRHNWMVAVGRRHPALIGLPPLATRRRAAIAVGVIVVVACVAFFYDARLIAWAATLPRPVHRTFNWITRYGQSDWLLIPSAIVAIVVALGDWSRVSRPNAAAWREIGTFALVIFVVVAATGLAADIVKPMVGRFRPEYAAPGTFVFAPFSLGGYAHYSFPSGHATTMGALVAISAFVPNVATIVIAIAAGLVAISRIVVGVHFPSDVTAGALLGFGVGTLILRAMAAAGIGYVVRANGAVQARVEAIRRLRRRRDGFAGLFPALWIALSPPPPPAETPPRDRP